MEEYIFGKYNKEWTEKSSFAYFLLKEYIEWSNDRLILGRLDIFSPKATIIGIEETAKTTPEIMTMHIKLWEKTTSYKLEIVEMICETKTLAIALCKAKYILRTTPDVENVENIRVTLVVSEHRDIEHMHFSKLGTKISKLGKFTPGGVDGRRN